MGSAFTYTLNWNIVFDVVNPFPSNGFPIGEYNGLALDSVKSVSALSAHSAVKGLTLVNETFVRGKQQEHIVLIVRTKPR